MFSRIWIQLAAILVVAYCTLYFRVGEMAFVGADEPRYARIGEEMLLSGSFVTPTLEGRPWLEKPPLLFWTQAASFSVLGVNEFAARFPSLIAASLAVLAVWLFSTQYLPQSAYLVPLVLLTTPFFFVFGRAASTDMLFSAFLGLALLSVYRACDKASLSWGALSGVWLALAVLAKGPVGIILYLGIVLLYLMLVRPDRWPWRQLGVGLLFTVGLSSPWFWFVWQENGYNFLSTFFLNHHLARMLTNIHHHAQPIFYYLPVLAIGAFPWLFLIRVRPERSEKGQRILAFFLWSWLAFPVLFFSLSVGKLPGYILPVFPAVALLVGLNWPSEIGLIRRRLALVLGTLMLVALAVVVFFTVRYQETNVGLAVAIPLILTASLGLLFRRQQSHTVPPILVLGFTLFAAVLAWAGTPIVEAHHSARSICALVSPRLGPENPLIQYRFFHHTALYYCGYQATRQAIANEAELEEYLRDRARETHFIVTQAPGLEDLKRAFNLRRVEKVGNIYLVEIVEKAKL